MDLFPNQYEDSSRLNPSFVRLVHADLLKVEIQVPFNPALVPLTSPYNFTIKTITLLVTVSCPSLFDSLNVALGSKGTGHHCVHILQLALEVFFCVVNALRLCCFDMLLLDLSP